MEKHYEEKYKEFPNAKPGFIIKPIIFDALIHLKIQGIIPNDTYPNGILYAYVDVWERLEKEGLLNFLDHKIMTE